MTMWDDRDRYPPKAGTYCPRSFGELASDPIPLSLLNEPLPPDNVRALVPTKQRSLHAVLCEALIDAQAMLARLEAGVHVPCDGQRARNRSHRACHSAGIQF